MSFNRDLYTNNYKEGKRIRGARITYNCLRCGEQIDTYVSQIARVYCSRECKWQAKRKKIEQPCDFCGKTVEVEPARLKWSKIRGRGKIFCNRECQRKGNSGEGSSLWIQDRSKVKDRRHSERNSRPYIEWRVAVFERDKYTCQKCGSIGGYLHAHHIKEWEYYPELRYDIDNGITLCRRPCHKQIHDSRRANRKISDRQIEEIKTMRENGATLREIGKKYNVSESNISVICAGKKRTKNYVYP